MSGVWLRFALATIAAAPVAAAPVAPVPAGSVPAVHVAAAPDSTLRAWFARHAYIGAGGSLAVMPGQRLAQGDSVLLFRAGGLEQRRIAYVIDADSAKRAYEELGPQGVEADPALWSRIGAHWFLGHSNPAMLAQYHDLFDTPGDALALDRLPAAALAIGGEGMALTPRELSALRPPLAAAARGDFASPRAMRIGRRHALPRGGELAEVLIGVPHRSGDAGTPMDSVRIRRIFLRDGRVLAVQAFTRVTGVEEHVDVEAPRLDEGNWFETSSRTLGFLSLDGGASWSVLDMDVGFEGILWTISRLDEGMPFLWEGYLYVMH
jgi:hypothetical protein